MDRGGGQSSEYDFRGRSQLTQLLTGSIPLAYTKEQDAL
jgi:hypothetical protein